MSLIDGIYWENEYRKEKEFKLEKERNEKLQNEFNGKMPCNNCKIKDMCKFAYSIEFKGYNQDVFNVEITCKNMIK